MLGMMLSAREKQRMQLLKWARANPNKQAHVCGWNMWNESINWDCNKMCHRFCQYLFISREGGENQKDRALLRFYFVFLSLSLSIRCVWVPATSPVCKVWLCFFFSLSRWQWASSNWACVSIIYRINFAVYIVHYKCTIRLIEKKQATLHIKHTHNHLH